MLKQIILTFFTGLGVLTAFGHPVHSVSDTSRLENALLWKISGNDLKHDSYVFGTIHIIDGDDYFLPDGTEAAMQKAGKFVFEIDMKEMTDISTQISMLTKALMNNGTRLKDLVTPEDYTLVSTHFESMGLPMFMLDRIKPMFLTVFASADMSPSDFSSGEMRSYEMEFFDYTQEHKKETGGLETIEFQLSVFDSIPYKAQAEMLVESIKSEEDQSGVLDEMIGMYKQQDIESLYKVIGDEEGGTGEYEDLLLRNRNQRWMSGMRTFMNEGPVFFAVGAGHLGGENGVIRLLRKEGYTLTPVLKGQTP